MREAMKQEGAIKEEVVDGAMEEGEAMQEVARVKQLKEEAARLTKALKKVEYAETVSEEKQVELVVEKVEALTEQAATYIRTALNLEEDLKEGVVNGAMEEKAMGAAMREQAVTKKNERALQADDIPLRQSSNISVF